MLGQNEVDLHTYLDTKVAAMGVWCGYFEISLMGSYFGIDITVFMATQPISRFSASEFLNSRHQKLAEFRDDQNTCPHIYIYRHQYQRPLTPAERGHDYRLNQFLCLIPIGANLHPLFPKTHTEGPPIMATVMETMQAKTLDKSMGETNSRPNTK